MNQTAFRHLVILVLSVSLLHAQQPVEPPRSNEPGITRQQADQILNELRAIRQVLERQPGAAIAPPSSPTNWEAEARRRVLFGIERRSRHNR